MTDPDGILVVLPTRGRRRLLARCVDTFAATAESADMLIVMDDDDPSYEGMEFPPRVRTETIPRMTLAPKNNHAAVKEAPFYRAVIVVGDDHTFDTLHWDRIFLAALDDIGGSGIVYPDDVRRRDNAEISLISSDIITALGWFCLPTLKHYWADNVISDLGRHAGCLRYCPEAVIEHHHYSVDPETPFDATYEYGESFGTADFQAYQAWRRGPMKDDVDTVKKVLAARGAGYKLTFARGANGESAGHGSDQATGAVRQAAGIAQGDH